MHILFCGSGWLPMIDCVRARLPTSATIGAWDHRGPLVEVVGDVDVLLPSNAAITADVITAAKRLRLIQQPAAGTERIDVAAAAARGIPVCNAPGTNQVAVAEATLFLLLSLARRAPAARQAFDARQVGVPLGIELAGRTLGVIGMGRVGSAVAERARALGMRVIALSRSASHAERAGFFASCDAITIHCPLTEETRGLVDAAAFAAMKPGALLVNLARGGVIDRAALVESLRSDRLGGVGLDVHWDEPADPGDLLYADPRVVALPHIAGSTEEAFARIADVVVANIARLDRGEPLVNRVG